MRSEDMIELPRDFPLGREALAFYLENVPVAARRLKADPEALAWLSDPSVCASTRGKGRIYADLASLDPGAADDPALVALRKQRGRELLRIGLRDLSGAASLEETTSDLSDLADVCLEVALKSRLAQLAALHGEPGTPFAIIGMGKLGGRELNFSSDIDVIFLYGEEGEIPGRANMTRHRYFNLLAERIVAVFSAPSAAGPLFRMDLRLRPEGASGPLVRSLDAMEIYYAGRGETWERMALTKARFCAGDRELAYEFLQHLQPFIYPRHIYPGTLDEIAAVKARTEREVVGLPNLERHIKLGPGGIREIEFIVQALQILHGARHPFLQEPNTLRALERLPRAGLLNEEEAVKLAAACRLLRHVEHRLQMPEEMQTHSLPDTAEGMERLAVMSGFESGHALEAALRAHRQTVREIFVRTIQNGQNVESVPLDLSRFENPEEASRTLESLAEGDGLVHQTLRTRKSFFALRPALAERLAAAGDPDAALALFARFVGRYGLRGLLFESLATNPRLLDLLIGLFDHSPFLSEVAIRRPQIIEEIARDGSLGRARGVADHLERFRANDEDLDPLEWARVYRREAILRIALRDILGFAAVEEVAAEYTAVAEAALLFCVETLRGRGAEVPEVVALGKFGGKEVAYGSDLDIFFVSGAASAASDLIRAMGASTAEGILFPLDARLRPDGVAGSLTFSTEQFASYHAPGGRAGFWEKQILTKARPITRSAAIEAFMQEAETVWREAGRSPVLWSSIRDMMARVSKSRSGSDQLPALKTGFGGLMTIEFLVQGKLMRTGYREPSTLAALEALCSAGVISSADTAALVNAYKTLRRVEMAMRRRRNEPLDTLPTSRRAREQLAIRLGLSGEGALLEMVRVVKEAAADCFNRLAGD